jgi:hypothetical protein
MRRGGAGFEVLRLPNLVEGDILGFDATFTYRMSGKSFQGPRMGALMEPNTKAESLLAEKAGMGEEASCVGPDEDRKIRPAFLRALMLGLATDKAGGESVRPIGVARLTGATVTGDLNLSLLGSAGAPLPGLILNRCTIEGRVDLSGARLGEVDLRWCHLKEFRAPRAHIDGQLMLFRLTLPEGAAIDLDHAIVAHWLNIERCEAEARKKDGAPASNGAAGEEAPRLGAITLRSASIGADLSLQHLRCGGFQFAINAQNLVVSGTLTLSDANTVGEVRFAGAKIGGQLNVSGATLTAGESGMALNAQGADIGGGVFLAQATSARGEVSFAGAKIGGQLNVIGATLTAGESGFALNLTYASVGSLFIRDAAAEKGRAPVKITGILFAPDLIVSSGVSIDTEPGKGANRCLILDGAMDFRNLKAASFTLTEASIRPNEKSAEHHKARAADFDLVLRLSHAEITGKLTIRLDDTSETRRVAAPCGEKSKGVVDLGGAKIGTLDDDWNRGWGDAPKQNADKRIASGVACLLDGLVYDRIEIDGRSDPPELPKDRNFLRQWRDNLFRADRQLIRYRLDFVERMYRGELVAQGTFFPQPYRELAATLRDMGRGYAARSVLGNMEWRSLHAATDSRVSGLFSRLYGKTYGFGYSSPRALGTLFAVWLFAWVGFAIAENYETPWRLIPERPVATLDQAPPPAENSSKIDAKPMTPRAAAHPVALRKIFAAEQGPYDWAPACESAAWLYAIDVMLPILDLKVESGCGFLDEAWGWHLFRLVVTVLGAITIPLAALTFTGLLQRS